MWEGVELSAETASSTVCIELHLVARAGGREDWREQWDHILDVSEFQTEEFVLCSCVGLLGLPLDGLRTEIYYLKIQDARSLRSRCSWQGHFLLTAVNDLYQASLLTCRWSFLCVFMLSFFCLCLCPISPFLIRIPVRSWIRAHLNDLHKDPIFKRNPLNCW